MDADSPLLVSDGAWKCALDETSIQLGLTSLHEFNWEPQWHAPSVVPAEYTSRRKYLPCNLPPPVEQPVRPVRVFAPFEPERLEDIILNLKREEFVSLIINNKPYKL